MIDEVVGDLECKTDVAGVAAAMRAGVVGQPAHYAGSLNRKFDKGAGLELLHPRYRRNVERLSLGGEIEHLPASHALEARGLGETEQELAADEGVLVRGRIRHDFEGQVMKTVTGEHSGRFVKGPVNCRLPAPEIIIVHARQIVVDEGIDVDGLNCRSGPHGAPLVDPEKACGGDGQQRPDPLAPPNGGVAHRLEQARAAIPRDRQIKGKQVVDRSTDPPAFAEHGWKRSIDHFNRHRTARSRSAGHRARAQSARSSPGRP